MRTPRIYRRQARRAAISPHCLPPITRRSMKCGPPTSPSCCAWPLPRRPRSRAGVAHAPSAFAVSVAGAAVRTAFLRDLFGAGPDESSAAAATTLDRTRVFLFAAQAPQSPAWDDSLDYFSAPGEGAECVEICRRIRRAGVPFDRIAILLRDPDRYHPFIEEAMRRAEIPAWFSRGVMRPDPAGRAFLALLECAREGCSATRFSEYLSLGQVPSAESNGARALPYGDELLAPFLAGEPEIEPEPPDTAAE